MHTHQEVKEIQTMNEGLTRIISDKTIRSDESAWSECQLSNDKHSDIWNSNMKYLVLSGL